MWLTPLFQAEQRYAVNEQRSNKTCQNETVSIYSEASLNSHFEEPQEVVSPITPAHKKDLGFEDSACQGP